MTFLFFFRHIAYFAEASAPINITAAWAADRVFFIYFGLLGLPLPPFGSLWGALGLPWGALGVP